MRQVALLVVAVLAGVALAEDRKPRTSEAVYQALEEPVHLLFNGDSFEDVLATITSQTGVVFVVDESVAKKSRVGFRIRGGSLARALDVLFVVVPGDPTLEVWRGAILVTSDAHPRPIPPAPQLGDDAKKALAEKRIDADWNEKPLAEVAAAISKAAGLPLALGEGVLGKVTLHAKNLPVASCVDIVCRLGVLKVVTESEKLVLAKVAAGDQPGPAETVPDSFKAAEAAALREVATGTLAHRLLTERLTKSFDKATLDEVVREVKSKIGGFAVVLDQGFDPAARATFEAKDATLKTVLARTLDQIGGWFEVGGGVLRIHKKGTQPQGFR